MNIIETLNNIKIEDLKNIDIEEIKSQISSRPDIIVIILAVTIALGSMVMAISSYQGKASAYKSDLISLKNKVDIIKSGEKIKKEYKKKVESFPKKISKEALGKVISDFALRNEVQILSFTPGKIYALGDVATIQNFSLSVNVPDDKYDNLILFTKDIEDSEYAIRIEKWEGSMGTASRRTSRNRRIQSLNTQKKINADITIQLVTINE